MAQKFYERKPIAFRSGLSVVLCCVVLCCVVLCCVVLCCRNREEEGVHAFGTMLPGLNPRSPETIPVT
jgi:hypothetical protein